MARLGSVRASSSTCSWLRRLSSHGCTTLTKGPPDRIGGPLLFARPPQRRRRATLPPVPQTSAHALQRYIHCIPAFTPSSFQANQIREAQNRLDNSLISAIITLIDNCVLECGSLFTLSGVEGLPLFFFPKLFFPRTCLLHQIASLSKSCAYEMQFCNSFLLIFIRIAGGTPLGCGPSPVLPSRPET